MNGAPRAKYGLLVADRPFTNRTSTLFGCPSIPASTSDFGHEVRLSRSRNRFDPLGIEGGS